ncbi:MAG: GAF domain-containing protein [Candidatus Eisenbacteria bacterium]|nr:GAF domain-containing protein [Candidatus Eisenbacteria bacterium]
MPFSGVHAMMLGGAALAALAAVVWLFRAPRLSGLLLAVGYALLAGFLALLGRFAADGLQENDLRWLARIAVPMSGAGLAAAMTFGRDRPWAQLASRGRVWLAWVIGAAGALYASGRPEFASVLVLSTGGPTLLLGWPATASMVGHLVSLIGMAILFETTLRAAGPDQRRALKPALVGFFLGLGYFLLCISASLLFNRFYEPLWLASPVPVAVASVLGLAGGLNRQLSDARIPVGRSVIYSSVSVFLSGLYVLTLGVVGEVVRLSGLPFGSVAVVALAFLAFAGVAVFFVSNRVRRRVRGFVDRNFFLTHYDYRKQWSEANARLRAGLKTRPLFAAASEMLQDAFTVRDVSLFLRRPGAEILDLVHSTVPGGPLSVIPDEPLPRQLVRTRQAFLLSRRADDFESVPIWVENHAILERTGARAWCPLLVGGEMVGMLGLGPRLNDLRFSYEDLDYLDALSEHLANALWGARLAEAWEEEGEQDSIHKMAGFAVHDLQSLQSRAQALSAAVGADAPEKLRESARTVCEALDTVLENWARLLPQAAGARVRCDLNDLVREAVGELALNGARPRVELAEQLGEALPPVQVDPPRLRGVIRTLLTNAMEAMPAGGKLTLTTRPEQERAGHAGPTAVVLSVTDSGAGMTRDFQEQLLFRPFVTTKEHGMGIGLFQSKQLVEAHGGSLRVSSEPGRGTTVELELPVARPA